MSDPTVQLPFGYNDLDKFQLYGEIGGRPITDRSQVLGKTKIKELHCVVKSCLKDPNDVCIECQKYVCTDHVHRHPDCDQGR